MDHDPFYLKEVRKLRCIACGAFPPNEAHHVRTRGAGGKDDYWNLIPLCNEDHISGPNAWHKIGPISFLYRFPWVMTYLIELGWQVQDDRLIPPLIRTNVKYGSIDK